MLRFVKKLTTLASSKRGAKWTLVIWLLLAFMMGGLAPSAKEFATSIDSTGLPNDAKSMIADQKLQKYFAKDIGIPALLVFHKDKKLTAQDLQNVDHISQIIEDKQLKTVKEVVPFYKLPPQAKQSFLSENQTTILLPVNLKDGLERKQINQTVKQLEKTAKAELKGTENIQLKVTGPAGIVSDMIAIFANADIVLMLGTVGLIFILLILIYRSPLLAFVPLIGAGIVYEIVNKTLGIFGKNGLTIESQSLSIMSILLFAALTDYALFIVARYKEELRKEENKYTAMKLCMEEVSEPILFSGSTVLAAMLVLFLAIFEPYRNFAPVFSIALVIILFGGLTLLPALFVLLGRKAFWPSIPKVGSKESKSHLFWIKLSSLVVKRPVMSGAIIIIILITLSLNTMNIKYSFNLIKSFPEDIQSRQGYELLEKNYPGGELAPTTVIVEGKEKLDMTKLESLRQEILNSKGVKNVTPDLSNPNVLKFGTDAWLTEDGKTAKLQVVFSGNPYDQQTMDHLNLLRDHDNKLVKDADLNDANLYFAGETAKQSDTRDVNDRDTWVVVIAITLLITVLLAVQTKSLIAPLYMILTIILSYFTALGTSFFIFNKGFGFDAISYRIPLYAFIFLVALGVDYNIMLISRIKEEARTHSIKEAIEQGLSHTGGVISSAGLILAATFAVLITQPLMELYMFGTAVAIGVIIDTFLVRTILVPAIMVKLGKWSLWPQKVKTNNEDIQKG